MFPLSVTQIDGLDMQFNHLCLQRRPRVSVTEAFLDPLRGVRGLACSLITMHCCACTKNQRFSLFIPDGPPAQADSRVLRDQFDFAAPQTMELFRVQFDVCSC